MTLLWERSPVFSLLASSNNKSFLLLSYGLVVSIGSSPTRRQTQFSGNNSCIRAFVLALPLCIILSFRWYYVCFFLAHGFPIKCLLFNPSELHTLSPLTNTHPEVVFFIAPSTTQSHLSLCIHFLIYFQLLLLTVLGQWVQGLGFLPSSICST